MRPHIKHGREPWRRRRYSSPRRLAFSFLATFSDIKIYKDLQPVHFAACAHKQSVSFPFKIQGLREGKHFCRQNEHKRAQTSSVPSRTDTTRLDFLSITNSGIVLNCIWKEGNNSHMVMGKIKQNFVY